MLLIHVGLSLGQIVGDSDLASSLTSGDTLNLENCLNYALEGNPDLRLAVLGVQMTSAQRSEIAGQRLPSMGLGAGYTQFSENQRLAPAGIPNDPGAYGQGVLSADLTLAMPLFTWGKITADVGQASFRLNASEARLERVRQEVAFNVTAAFYGVVNQNGRLETAHFARRSLDEHKRRVEELFSAGKAAKVDLLKIEVRLGELDQRIIREEDLLKRQKLLLLNLMGLAVDADSLRLISDLDSTNQNLVLAWNLEEVYAQRSDYRSMEFLRDAQARKLSSAKAVRLPAVSAYASGGAKWMPDADVLQPGAEERDLSAKAGINLTLPLFQGGQLSARVQQQQIALAEVEESLKKARLQIRMEVETASNAHRTAMAKASVGQASVDQARETYRIEQEKFLLGKGTTADVLDTQTALLDAESNYLTALAEIRITAAQLRLALGRNQ